MSILQEPDKGAIHTFEIPEVFSLPVGQGDVQYLKWIEDGMEED